MLDLLRFLIFTFVYLWVPGELFVQWVRIHLPFGQRIPVSIVISISLLILVSLGVRYLQLPWEVLYFYGIGSIIAGIRYTSFSIQKITQEKITLYDIFRFLVFIACIVAISAVFLGSGIRGSLYLPAARDAFWRLSIIGELIHHFPPQNPGFPPELLKNYHFFYDLLLAAMTTLTKINPIVIYTEYATVLVASLFTFATYSALGVLVKNKWLHLYGTILTLFTGNLSYLVLRFISHIAEPFAKSNMFMSDQPIDQIHNPFNLLAYATVLVIFVLFSHWEKQRNLKTFSLIVICTTMLVGLKIYAGILVIIGLGAVSILLLVRRNFYWYLLVPFVTCFFVVRLIQGPKPTMLYFNPGWVLTKMVEDQDRLPLPEFVLKEQYYESTGNVLRLIQIKIQELLIYFLGNLNIRIFGIGGLIFLFFQKKFSKLTMLFITTITGAAFLLPLLFSQTRGVYDSIQFTPYGLILLGLLTVVGIEVLIKKLPGKIQFSGIIIITVSILGLAIPTTIAGFSNISSNRFYIINKPEVEALNYIRTHTSYDVIILTDLDLEKLQHMYIPAISERRTFLSGTSLVEQTGIDTTRRQQEIQQLFQYDEFTTSKDLTDKKNYLKAQQIGFIYLSKSGLTAKTLMSKLDLPIFYQSEDVVIYQVI